MQYSNIVLEGEQVEFWGRHEWKTSQDYYRQSRLSTISAKRFHIEINVIFIATGVAWQHERHLYGA